MASTDAATRERLRIQAHRSVDNPMALAKAVRIVCAGLARGKITLADLTPLPAPAPKRTGS